MSPGARERATWKPCTDATEAQDIKISNSTILAEILPLYEYVFQDRKLENIQLQQFANQPDLN